MVDRKKQDDRNVNLYVVLKVHKKKHLKRCVSLYLKYSSLAQSVEHAAVNRSVVGSSPTGGAERYSGIALLSRFPGIFFSLFLKNGADMGQTI